MSVEIFSFFSGLGFLDLGFESLGFNISFVNEFNHDFLRAYQYARRNSGHVPQYGYSNESMEHFLEDEVWDARFKDYSTRPKDRWIGFIGGPPCPDFSTAGKNAGSTGKHGQLTEKYVRLIIKRKPDFFVLENVKGLYQTKKHKAFYETMKKRLYRSGYSIFDSIENSLEYGTPQFRDRLILIGFRRDTFGKGIRFEIGRHKMYDMNEINQKEWPETEVFTAGIEKAAPQNIIRELTVEYWFEKNNVENHPNGQDCFNTVSNKFNTIAEGDTSRKSFKRLHRWRYSPTAAYGNNEVHLHPYHARRISVAEALAIQSLPEEFEVLPELSLSAKFKMVGNGVPFLLAQGVARDLNEWLEEYKVQRDKNDRCGNVKK
jgi:DNA (cytosine-5)-methyltransferase 1